MTMNLHCLQEANPRACLQTLAETIINEGYDLIFLQELVEVIAFDLTTEIHDTGAYLIAQLKRENSAYQLVKSYAHESWGNCREYVGIITRLPIIQSQTVVLSERSDPTDIDRRVAQSVQIETDGKIVCCLSTHMSWPENNQSTKFLEQLDQLNQYVKTLNMPIILGGDLNITPDTKEYHALLAAGWVDAYYTMNHQHDWTCIEYEGETISYQHIDYILTNRSVVTTDVYRIFTTPTQMISDHVGVSAECTIL